MYVMKMSKASLLPLILHTLVAGNLHLVSAPGGTDSLQPEACSCSSFVTMVLPSLSLMKTMFPQEPRLEPEARCSLGTW